MAAQKPQDKITPLNSRPSRPKIVPVIINGKGTMWSHQREDLNFNRMSKSIGELRQATINSFVEQRQRVIKELDQLDDYIRECKTNCHNELTFEERVEVNSQMAQCVQYLKVLKRKSRTVDEVMGWLEKVRLKMGSVMLSVGPLRRLIDLVSHIDDEILETAGKLALEWLREAEDPEVLCTEAANLISPLVSASPRRSFFMHYTISQDRCGDEASTQSAILAELGAREEKRSRFQHAQSLQTSCAQTSILERLSSSPSRWR